jgi:hypothetical protein
MESSKCQQYSTSKGSCCATAIQVAFLKVSRLPYSLVCCLVSEKCTDCSALAAGDHPAQIPEMLYADLAESFMAKLAV